MDPSAHVHPSPDDVANLRARLRGHLLERSDDDYDAARVVWNGMIDRRPSFIACCAGTADVIESLGFARRHGLKLSVRGGGHNVAGYAVCEGGLMIDLSAMRAVRVDPIARRAWVQGGALWADVDCETAAFGLATPGGLISRTGVAGLTLSGGIGWLRGRHGLCVDNLEAVDIVTADGQLRRADANENTDLFWAVRGGGGNFGVVTGFTFRLHPIPPSMMFCGPAYPEAEAGALIPLWRDFMASAPEWLSSLAEFSTIPNDPAYPEAVRGQRVISFAAVYDGPPDEGEALVAPLRAYGTPLADFSGVMQYRTIQSLYDALFPKGRDRCYWKSLYLRSLDNDAIDAVVAYLAKRPSEMTFASIWALGGAMQRVPATATAFGDRSAPYMLSLDAIWSQPSDDAANVDWARAAWADMQRHGTGRMYLNFPGHGEDNDLVRSALGPDVYARLAQVKRVYDPGNLFRMNQNVLPEGAQERTEIGAS
jgi:FAD/FMN-containing dehydrogenase